MEDFKATITFNEGGSLDFHIWNGSPQKIRPVYDMFRRLGSKQQRIQVTGVESNVSTSRAITYFETADAAFNVAEMFVNRIHERFTLSYYGQEFENCILLNAEYNIVHLTSQFGNHELEFILTYLLDGEDDD